MMPRIPTLIQEVGRTMHPNRTYRIQFNDDEVSGKINGYIDGLDALRQSIYLILMTERYRFPIYSWDYGIELTDLIGQDMPYVIAELPRRIRDALIQDNRIDDVVDFEFDVHGRNLQINFTVVSNIGNISTDMGVKV